MAVQSFVGTFALGTGAATTTKAVTGVGFVPTVVLFWWSGLTALSAQTVGNHKFGAGFMISGTKRGGSTSQSEFFAGTSSRDHEVFDDSCIKMITILGVVDGAADFQSFDVDGFTVVIDDQFAADYRINFLAMAGVSAETLSFSEPASPSTVSYSAGVNLNTGRDDKAVLFFSGARGGVADEAVNTIYAQSGWCIGAAAGSAPLNACMGGSGLDNSVAGGADTDSYCDDRYCVAPIGSSIGNPVSRGAVSAWTSTGFTMVWTEANGATRPIIALILHGTDFRAAIKTGYTKQVDGQTFGLKPGVFSRAALFASCGQNRPIDDTSTDQDGRSLGAATSTTNRAYASMQDGEPTLTQTEIGLAQNTDAVIVDWLASSVGVASIDGRADVSFFGHTDVRLVMDDPDQLPGFFWVLFMGDPQVGGAAPTTFDVEARLPIAPDEIAGLTAWWRADDLVGLYSEGQAVTTWPSAGGSVGGTLALQTSSPGWLQKSVKKFGGRAGVRMSGTDQWAVATAISSYLGADGVGSIFIVYRLDNALNTTQTIFSTTSNMLELKSNPSTPNITATATDSGGADSVTKTTNLTPTAFAAHCGFWGKDVTNVYVGCDAIETADLSSAASGASVAGATTPRFGNAGTIGDLAEVLIYNSFLSEANRKKILFYLALKYGRLGTWDATTVTQATKGVSANFAWKSVYSDVSAKEGIQFRYGMGGEDTDRVAGAGTLSLSMRNMTPTLFPGYYSPGHPACRVGWDIGTSLRLKFVFAGTTRYKWRGKIVDVDAVAGKANKVANVSAADWMDEAARTKMQGVAVQTNKRADELFATLFGQIDSPPALTSISTSTDVYATTLDNTKDESTAVLTEFAKLAASELGFVYVKRDATEGETLVFESRTARGAKITNDFVIDEFRLRSMKATRSRNDVVNSVKVQVHRRRIDATATTVLFSIPVSTASLLYVAGALYPDFIAPYRDPSQPEVRVGGTEMVTPVATTDYTANTLADGSGVDVTVNFSVVATYGGNTVVINVVNNGKVDAFLTKLQVRGKGVYAFESAVARTSDQDSINLFGENEVSFDMPYQNRVDVAQEAAAYILNRGLKARQRLRSATYFANRDPDSLSAALTLEPGDRIGVQEQTVGIYGAIEPEGYFIAGVSFDMVIPGHFHVTYALMPADNEQFWILDKVGYSELDESTILGFSIF